MVKKSHFILSGPHLFLCQENFKKNIMKKSMISVLMVFVFQIGFSQSEVISDLFIKKINIRADVVYGSKYGVALTFDVFQPPESNGAALVFMNSGGFVSGKVRYIDTDKNLQIKYLRKEELMIFPERFKYPPLAQFSIDELMLRGFTVFDVRQGSDPKFTLDEITGDCRMAVNFIREHASKFRIDANRIGVLGASSGGYLASFMGTDTLGVKSVVAFYPVGYDLMRIKREFTQVYDEFSCLKIDTLTLDKLSIKNRINHEAASFLIIYGKDDYPFVTIDSEEMAADLKNHGVRCEIIPLEGTGHELRGKDGYNVQYGEFARMKMVEWFTNTLLDKK